jgi:hypothetical protein
MRAKSETDISTGRRIFRVSCDCRPMVYGILFMQIITLVAVVMLGWMIFMGTK